MPGSKHKKILIIGSSGAGKSTFSKQLAKKWDLPLVHLDSLYWNEGWVPVSKDEFIEKVKKKLEEDQWIIDGNFNSTLEWRVKYADLIIFLDFRRTLCTYRVLKRVWKHHGKTRDDMASGCNEKLDWDFLKFVWGFPSKVRPTILKVLSEAGKSRDICILRNPKELKTFLNTVSPVK
ncbi:DNA topology modulation protein [Psychrobacillus sp. FSL W7-1457]|uniref:DNA topology modulation protein n=1 Tax=Psychrobacillus sp. FSL W7-1457 TaxID=2954547 RepID=UPI003159A5FA